MADSTLLDLALILTGLATGGILVHALIDYFTARRPSTRSSAASPVALTSRR